MTATVKSLHRIHAKCCRVALFAATCVAVTRLTSVAIADTNSVTRNQLLAHSQKVFAAAQEAYEVEPTNNVVAWQFAKAAFLRGEVATNDTDRAAVAVQGIAAARKTLQRDPKCMQAHYYLALNLGQLARTKLLGALSLVSEMEESFKKARQLDETFDYAGAHRFLGQLYHQAPSWSVGSESKARTHLERAVELAPVYPENRICLAEASLKWRDKKLAQRELKALQKLWPAAKTNFVGADWDVFWADWQPRYDKLVQRINR
jgi:tetratricopeptide (TPR) repeat protein